MHLTLDPVGAQHNWYMFLRFYTPSIMQTIRTGRGKPLTVRSHRTFKEFGQPGR